MPTATFYHLPDEKREKILLAIKAEFARVPFHDVSINQIIRAAEISRGSFYQYFKDKDDMLDYVLSAYQARMLAASQAILRANEGDVFRLFEELLAYTIAMSTEEETSSFCQNLFADVKVNSGFYQKKSKGKVQAWMLEELMPTLCLDDLDLRAESDVADMADILFDVFLNTVAEIFLDFSNRETAIQRYHRQLALLQRGFAMNKE